jgi:4,4'-diaponeurosporenoate glycosyltransferase
MILLAVTLALWFAGWIVLGRIRRCGRDDPNQSLTGEQLSIIIPARNEEQNLPTLLRSLNAQSIRPREIIVVDDASTDRTAELAQQNGARVIPSLPLPEGWRGKTWACHQGAQAATGEMLLFLDADTWFEPEGLRCVLAEFGAVAATPRRSRVVAPPPSPGLQLKPCAGGGASTLGDEASPLHRGVLSVAPYHVVKAPYEQLSAFFNLVMLAGTGAFTLWSDRLAPRGLLGQFLLIERTAYQRVGGHEAVKGRILENFWLAEQLRAQDVPLRCRSGHGVFSFRMYPQGWRELVAGWTKGFASGAGQTPLPILLLVIAWMNGLMLPLIGLVFAGDPGRWLAVYGLSVIQIAWLLRCVGTFHWSTAVLYPLPLIFYFVVFTRSMLRSRRKQTVAWKGRQIRAD